MPPTEDLGRKVRLDEIASPIIHEGLAYWRSKCAGRPFPSRADINPAEIKRLLPNVILARMIDDGRDYEFRIVGEATVTAHGFNSLNTRVSDLDKHVRGYTAMMMDLFGRIRRSGRPFAAKGTLVHLDRGFKQYESLYMPLGPDEKTIDHMIAFTDYSGEVL